MTIQIKNTIDIECLIQALENMQVAKTAYDEARDNYQGYSWDYHGRYYVQQMEKNAEEFGDILNKLIENKVIEVLAAHNVTAVRNYGE